MAKNKVDKKKNRNDMMFAGILFLSAFAAYTANEAYNKSKSAQSNLDLKLSGDNIVSANSGDPIKIVSTSTTSGAISLISNGGTDGKIVIQEQQGDKNDSIEIKSNSGGITLNGAGFGQYGGVHIKNLPDSGTGLVSGQLWNNNGVLNIKN